MDQLLGILCLLAGILVVVAVVGHGLWIAAAAVLRALSGNSTGQAAGTNCRHCGSRATVHAGRCVACGAVPAVAPGEETREEARAASRQLWRLLQQGRITQQQYDAVMAPLLADLARHGVSAPPAETTTAPMPVLQARSEPSAVVDAELVEVEAVPPPVVGEPSLRPPSQQPQFNRPATQQPPVPQTLRPQPDERSDSRFRQPAAAAQASPRAETPATPPASVFVEPPRPARSTADMLQSFMEESNIRWGEILAAFLIVISSVGMVISLRNQLKEIPYFAALLFTVFTVAFHGAGMYTLRRWKLQAVSRVILIISLLLVPLTFSAAVVMSGSGEAMRPVTDPLFLAALGLGLTIFGWVTWSASRELVSEGWWRLSIGVLGPSLAQVLIQRVNLTGADFWRVNLVALVPLACFLVAVAGQLLRARQWPRLSHRRAGQVFLVLGIASFALLAPLALLLVRAEPRWTIASWLSPLLSLAGAAILATGLLVQRRAMARELAVTRTAGTAVLIGGGMLLVMLVLLAWPDPELLCAVGVMNAVVLVLLAYASGLPILHAPAIGCAALAAVMGLHLAQGRFADREGLQLAIVQASLMARTSLVLTLLAAATSLLGLWQRRTRREEWLVYLGSAGVLAMVSLTIAAIAGFLPLGNWQLDKDLAGPIMLGYAVALVAIGPLTPWPAVAAAGSFLLWAGLVQVLRLNTTARTLLDGLGWLPARPILVATLGHAVLTAAVALVATGRRMLASSESFREFTASPRYDRLSLPLSIGSAIGLAAIVPMIFWQWHAQYQLHAAFAVAAAVAWGALALSMRWKGAISAMQAMLALAPAMLAAGLWRVADEPRWPLAAGHVQAQLILLAAGAVVWSLVRRLSGRAELARDLLQAEWPAVDQGLLMLANIGLPVWTLLASLPGLGWELGFAEASLKLPLASAALTDAPGHGWFALAAVLAAIGASLWERVSTAGLVAVGVAAFAAVWLSAQVGVDTHAVASAARWGAGVYAIATAALFLFREQIARVARQVTWLRWEAIPASLIHWFCAQPLVLGGASVLVLTIIAVAQNATGATLRGPVDGSIFHAMGPTVSYAGPLMLLVAVLLTFAVRERQAGFALGGSAVFQLAVNLAFILFVTTAETPLSPAIQGIMWLQWNAAAAGIYALVWLGLGRWIRRDGEQTAIAQDLASERPALADVLQWVQIALGSVLVIGLVAWAISAVVSNPRVATAEAAVVGRWLSYFAAAVVAAALAWHLRGRRYAPWGDLTIWLGFALAAFAACSVDGMDASRQWLAYHVLSLAWLAVSAIGTAAVVIVALIGKRSTTSDGSPRPLVAALNVYHFSAAAIALAVAALGIRGATADPHVPLWSLIATLGPLAILSALVLARRSQPYAYASVALAGLAAVLLLVAPRVATQLPMLLGRPPLAVIDLVALAVLVAAGGWLAAEIFFQRRRSESLDARFPGPRVHAMAILAWLAVLVPWQLFLLLPLNWIPTLGARIAVIANVAVVGGLLIATLWDRRAVWSLPTLFTWGLAAWTLAVNLIAERLSLSTGERFALLALAAGLHLAIAGQAWSYGANLSVIGTRAGISDPIGGLVRTERWLVPTLLTLAALVSAWPLILVLGLERLEYRAAAAWAPAIATWGVLCLAQEKRRDALQLASLLLAGLSAIYLGWAQLDPQESSQTWALSRAFRLLMVLAAATFVYGLVLPRLLLTAGSWNASVRRAGFIAGAAAMAVFAVVLGLEVTLFKPGVDAPIDGAQVAAIAVVLVGLVAGLLSLALLPGRDPLALSEAGRQWYVYAAEAAAALLLAHLYICRPTWFDGVLRPYWPLIVMGIAFVGVGVAELCHRFQVRVLAEPLSRTGALLPLLPVLGIWIPNAASVDRSFVLLVVGLLYLVLSATRKSWASLVAAAVAGNAALWVLLDDFQFDLTAYPQLWLIPPALSVLLAAQLNRHRLPPQALAAIRYLATIVIYLSSTSEIFIRGVGTSLWPPMILVGLAVFGAMLGIMLRIRAFLYLGTSFTVLALITMVAHAAQAIDHVWPWWAFGIGLGIVILVLFGIFEKKRAEMLALVARLRQWEQ
jgi:hypothetical protein